MAGHMSGQVGEQLIILRGSLHICPLYVTNANCSNSMCFFLHVCRAWLAGHCRTPGCLHEHNLRTEHNKRALAAVGATELPSDNNTLRQRVAIIFPQLCMRYVRGQCTYLGCYKLHMCKELLLNGSCRSPVCRLNHVFLPRERNILVKGCVKIPPENTLSKISPRNMRACLADVLCPDEIVADTKQTTASGAAAAESAYQQVKHVNSNGVLNEAGAVDSKDSKNPVNAINSFSRHNGGSPISTVGIGMGIGVTSDANSAIAAADLRAQPYCSSTALAVRFSHPHPSASDSVLASPARISDVDSNAYGLIKNVSCIVKYLLAQRGWAPWAQFSEHFQISKDFFEMRKWLRCKQNKSFTGQHADWIRPVYYREQSPVPDEVNMFRFARLCVHHQRGECTKGAACLYLHICAVFLIGSPCRNGESCALGHRLEGTILGQVPFPSKWSLDEKLRFVRECHPCICPEYNSAAGCPLGGQCFKLHVCNDLFLQRCAAGGSCARSHKNLESAEFERIYKHHVMFNIVSSLDPNLKDLFPYLIMPLATASASGRLAAAAAPTESPHQLSPANKVQEESRASDLAMASDKQSGAAQANETDAPTCITSCEAVFKFVIERGGSCTWHQFRLFFALNEHTTYSYDDLKKHLHALSKNENSYSANQVKFIYALDYSTGYPAARDRDPDAINIFRLVRVCANWNQNRGHCKPFCDYLHVCRNWLAGECAAGAGCALGHSFVATHVPRLPFPRDSSEARYQQFVRQCHPVVCTDYNSPAGCDRQECPEVHICNLFVLGRCGGCTRSHDTSAPECISVYKRFGIQDLPKNSAFKARFRWLLMPVKKDTGSTSDCIAAAPSAPSSAAFLHINRKEALNNLDSANDRRKSSSNGSFSRRDEAVDSGLKQLNLKAASGYRAAADFKSSQQCAAPTVPNDASNPPIEENVRRYFSMPPNVHELATTSKYVNQKPSKEPSTRPKHSSEEAAAPAGEKQKQLYLCESLLRGVCKKDSSSCEFFHLETPLEPGMFPDVDTSAAHQQNREKLVPLNYFWQYLVPRTWSSQAGFEYILEMEKESLTDDGWLWFDWSEEKAIEAAFSDPTQLYFEFNIENAGSDYPFAAGSVEIHFGSLSPEGLFKMQARLKKTAGDPTRPIELQARCLRAPSSCVMAGKCTRATKWFWWIQDPSRYFGQKSKSGWIDASTLFGNHMHEAESSYLEGKPKYSFEAKLPNSTRAPQSFTFNFENMTFKDEKNSSTYFELRRRPAPQPFVSRPSCP